MGIDCGLFCDTCQEFINLGEWMFTQDRFQRNELLWDFLIQHIGHCLHYFDDASDEWLTREYELNFKEYKPGIVEEKQS